jgi:hypothetical protein
MSLVTEHLAERGVAFESSPTGAPSPRSRKPGRLAWPPRRSSRRSRCGPGASLSWPWCYLRPDSDILDQVIFGGLVPAPSVSRSASVTG